MASCDVVKKSAHKIELDPAEEAVILIGLYLRVVDAASPKPLLGDIYAQGIINKVDCDFTRSLFTLDDNYVRYAAGRAKKMDVWCEDFLAQHGEEPVTVLNIACALDSRHLRIDRKSTVRWIDVDTPRVTSLRERLLEAQSVNYHLLAANFIDDDDWLLGIPADRPTFIILESFTMYLQPEKGFQLYRKLLNHFRHGRIATHTTGSLTVKFSSFLEALRESKAVVRWGVDDPKVLLNLDPRLKLLEHIYLYDFLEMESRGKNGLRLFGKWTPLISLLPAYRKNGQFLLFEF